MMRWRLNSRRPARGTCAAFALALAAVTAGTLSAQPVEPPPALTIPRVSRAPKIDDFRQGKPREAETIVTGFRTREPSDGKPVSQPTTAYLSYDDKNLYLVFVCMDKPGMVRARMSNREDISEDDQVSIYLDTFHDKQRAYVFTVNPLGIQSDAIMTEGGGSDRKFDTLWYSEGRTTRDGFVVWMAIPFRSLRFPNSPSQVWGIGLGRSFVHNSESSYWPYITKRLQGFVRQLGDMTGLQGIAPGRNFQLIPYLTFTHARDLDFPIPRYATTIDTRAGLDGKVVLHNSFTLDLTLNPDFSQVESDDPQVTVNQRFEVYFPEKRPFFTENSAFFDTPINLFFSRRIVDPGFGARLTGKVGRWALGVLAADDRAPGKRVDDSDPLHGERATILVGRALREFGRQSRIGVFASTRTFGTSSSRVLAVDTRLRFSPNWFFTGQLTLGYDRDLTGRRRQGGANLAQLAHSGRHFYYNSAYTDISPDFRARLGFVRRTDIRQTQHYVGYFWIPENSRITNIGVSESMGANWDRRGRLQDWNNYAQFQMDFIGPLGFSLSRLDSYELYLNQGYHNRRNGWSFYYNRWKRFSLYGSYGQGTGINYSGGAAANYTAFSAASTDAAVGFGWRPAPRLRVDESYLLSRLATNRHSAISGYTDPTAIFNTHIARTKVIYQFSRALSLRAILDYYAVLPNELLVSQTRYKQTTSDVLLTYLLHPGTALYFGFTNRYENLLLDPQTRDSVLRGGPPSYLTGSQFFMKMSYLFRR